MGQGGGRRIQRGIEALRIDDVDAGIGDGFQPVLVEPGEDGRALDKQLDALKLGA